MFWISRFVFWQGKKLYFIAGRFVSGGGLTEADSGWLFKCRLLKSAGSRSFVVDQQGPPGNTMLHAGFPWREPLSISCPFADSSRQNCELLEGPATGITTPTVLCTRWKSDAMKARNGDQGAV